MGQNQRRVLGCDDSGLHHARTDRGPCEPALRTVRPGWFVGLRSLGDRCPSGCPLHTDSDRSTRTPRARRAVVPLMRLVVPGLFARPETRFHHGSAASSPASGTGRNSATGLSPSAGRSVHPSVFYLFPPSRAPIRVSICPSSRDKVTLVVRASARITSRTVTSPVAVCTMTV